MLTKYASLESARVLGIKGSMERERTASLDKFSDFDEYRTQDGFLYARIRAISSRVNKNHDGWPSIELAGSRDIFDQHTASEGGFIVEANKGAKYGFSTFLGKPVFVDHHNSNPDRARGVIVDAKLHVEDYRTASELDPYYASAPSEHMPPTWVELLLEIDAKNFPHLAKAIIEGSKDSGKGIDGFSMGCNVERSVCSICKNSASSPEDYCQHVKYKGAHFDAIDHNGRKTSKRAYEDCYGVQFFEISAVFEPADETALIREVRASVNKEAEYKYVKKHGDKWVIVQKGTGDVLSTHDSEEDAKAAFRAMEMNMHGGSVHIAENPLPQADMESAPSAVDTMREEEICPVCGSTMDRGHQCDVCGYVQPPDGLDNPDLDKAKERLNQPEPETPGLPDALGVPTGDETTGLDNSATNIIQPAASVSNEMSWQLYHPKIGRINPVERPIQPGQPPATNEPNETIVSDQTRPTTSRTAASMIAAVKNKEHMSDTRTAAEPLADAAPMKRVDVTGVGGVIEPNNESASKADGQVDVEGQGSTGVDSVDADSHQSVEQTSDDAGFDTKKTTEDSGPTKTFDNSNEPDSAVTSNPFPASSEGVKSSWKIADNTVVSYDSEAFPSEDGGLAGGSAVKGTQPVDPVGKADDRVNLLQPVTSPANNSGKTKTWSGTDGNGVTKQQDPVTRETLEGSDIVDLSPGKSSHLFSAFKLADMEVDMGLISPDQKYERVAELENESLESVEASLKYAGKVKTAGLRKSASTSPRGVGRVPSFRPEVKTAHTSSEAADEGLFW